MKFSFPKSVDKFYTDVDLRFKQNPCQDALFSESGRKILSDRIHS